MRKKKPTGFIRDDDRKARQQRQADHMGELEAATESFLENMPDFIEAIEADVQNSFQNLPVCSTGVRTATIRIPKEPHYDRMVNYTVAQLTICNELRKREPRTRRVEIKADDNQEFLRINAFFNPGLQ